MVRYVHDPRGDRNERGRGYTPRLRFTGDSFKRPFNDSYGSNKKQEESEKNAENLKADLEQITDSEEAPELDD